MARSWAVIKIEPDPGKMPESGFCLAGIWKQSTGLFHLDGFESISLSIMEEAGASKLLLLGPSDWIRPHYGANAV